MKFSKEKSANFVYDAIVKRPGWFLRVISTIEGNEIVGGLHACCGDSHFGPDKLAWDITIMMEEEHRGRCLKQLVQVINEYKEWATKEGAKLIKFGVSSGLNIENADKFLQRVGFTKIGSMHGIVVGD
jgi:hypothetical protein